MDQLQFIYDDIHDCYHPNSLHKKDVLERICELSKLSNKQSELIRNIIGNINGFNNIDKIKQLILEVDIEKNFNHFKHTFEDILPIKKITSIWNDEIESLKLTNREYLESLMFRAFNNVNTILIDAAKLTATKYQTIKL